MPNVATRDIDLPRQPFGRWLLGQAERDDPVGSLAKRAALDPAFPRNGTVDAVSCRLNAVGAEGDVHAALEDAELDYLAY